MDLVKYHNELNKIALRKFNEKEINLFFSIIYKAKNSGSDKTLLNFIELKKLALTGREDKRLINSLKKMNNKLLDLKQEITLPDGKIVMFNIFNTFMIDPIEKNMIIKINENFEYMLNNLENYTKFELEQLVSFKSSYTKNMFRLLKQFESTKYFITTLDEFKRLLCIPNGYKMCDIDKRILKPISEELNSIFPNLKVEKVKKGREIDKLIFTWGKKGLPNSRKSLPLGGDTKVLEISEGLNKAIEKAKKNRFISSFMTIDNIEKLLDRYGDQKLTKGLYFASSEINVEIKYLTYITNCIEEHLNGIGNKKIVVKKVESNGLQGVEPKEEKTEGLKMEIKEPKKGLIKKTREEIILQSKKEGLSLKIINITLKALKYEEVTKEEFNV